MHRILPLLVLTIFTLMLLAFSTRPQIYSTVLHTAYNLGLNLNNIASDDYVSWIKSQPSGQTAVLGQTANVDDNKWIEVDLSEQRLYMKEGGQTVNSFLVSTGKWSPTPTGEWRIWTKLRYTRMKGGSKALGTFYDLPNVPYTMYYYKGYGIHGAYWHNNFGQPMSHGCVNMRPEEAGVVFNWASVGTRVQVHQ